MLINGDFSEECEITTFSRINLPKEEENIRIVHLKTGLCITTNRKNFRRSIEQLEQNVINYLKDKYGY